MIYGFFPSQTTHTKVLIVDEQLALLGSTNWTYSALTNNNEVSFYSLKGDRQRTDRLLQQSEIPQHQEIICPSFPPPHPPE